MMEKLQAILDAQIGKSNIHNIVAAVQSHDRSLDLIGAAGFADPNKETPMAPDTPYFIASVTKTFTAAIALRLRQEKRIDFDAPLSEYLPPALTQAIHVHKGTDYSDKIVVANLIDQTSGLADFETDKPRGGKSMMDELLDGQDREINLDEAVELTRELGAHFPPGTRGKAHYSNTNYRLLGEIIQTVTGKPMAVNFQEFICQPLGLQETYLFDWKAPRPGQGPAALYLKDAPLYAPKYLSSNVSDGGIVSTAAECIGFLHAFFEGQLFDKAYFDHMMDWKRIFFPLKYGYGLMRFKMPGTPEFIGHSGSTGSFAFTCPSESLYLAGTVNQIANPSKPFTLMSALVRAVK